MKIRYGTLKRHSSDRGRNSTKTKHCAPAAIENRAVFSLLLEVKGFTGEKQKPDGLEGPHQPMPTTPPLPPFLLLSLLRTHAVLDRFSRSSRAKRARAQQNVYKGCPTLATTVYRHKIPLEKSKMCFPWHNSTEGIIHYQF